MNAGKVIWMLLHVYDNLMTSRFCFLNSVFTHVMNERVFQSKQKGTLA